MRMKATTVLIGIFCFFLMAAVAGAADYKNWLPLMPETVGGLEKSGQHEGFNMNSGGKAWSFLKQKYAGDRGRARLMIISGAGAPQVQSFENMPEFNMESEKKIAKSLEVSGHKAFLEIDKNDSNGRLVVSVGSSALVVLHVTPVSGEKKMLSLADAVPLEKIAEAVSD